MAQFQPAVEMVMNNEGGLNESNVQHDPGGLTKYGISLRFLKSVSESDLRKYNIKWPVTEETIRELTKAQAISVYYGEFWSFFRFDEIEDQLLANYVFDTAINPNPNTAFRCVQRAIWTIEGYEACLDDGIMGSKTLALMNRHEQALLRPMMSERAGWYRNNSNPVYLDGWLRRAYREPY